MKRVTSRDGTTIAYERTGSGPAVILVGGALSDRTGAAPLASLLAPHLTAIAYDRRGRGDSGDTQPYAVEREVEDIAALVKAVGGSAFAFGHSSGAVLALKAAAGGAGISKLAMYEPPFITDTRPPLPEDYLIRLHEALAAGRRGDAVELFMSVAVGVPAEMLAGMKASPMWAGLEKVAHTLLYDQAVMGDNMRGHSLRAERWQSATMPAVVMVGGASPPWLQNSAKALAAALPNATFRLLQGQTHAMDPATVAPVLIEFFIG